MDTEKLHKYLGPILNNPSKKRWNIFKMESPHQSAKDMFAGEEEEEKQQIREPVEFRNKLKQALKPFFKSVVYTCFHDTALWAAIDLLSVGLKQPKTMLFLVHYPHAEFIFVSAFKNVAIFKFLHLAFCDAFDCEELTQVNCKGSNLESLADLALHPLSQGSFGAYRLYKSLIDNNAFRGSQPDDQARRNRIAQRQQQQQQQQQGGVVLEHGLELVQTSGALTQEQSQRETKGTEALQEIKLMIDHDLQVGGGDQGVEFACTLVVRGDRLMSKIKRLTGVRVVSGEDASECIADASHVISGALNHGLKKKKARHAPAEEDDLFDDDAQHEVKGVRTIGVGLM